MFLFYLQIIIHIRPTIAVVVAVVEVAVVVVVVVVLVVVVIVVATVQHILQIKQGLSLMALKY